MSKLIIKALSVLLFTILQTIALAPISYANSTSVIKTIDTTDDVHKSINYYSEKILKGKKEEIKNSIEDVKNSATLTDEAKKIELETLGQIDSYLQSIESLIIKERSFDKVVANLSKDLSTYEDKLNEAKIEFSKEPIIKVQSTKQELQDLLNTLNIRQKKILDKLNIANGEYVNYQSLPNRAQETIAKNTNALNDLNMKLTGSETLSSNEIEFIKTKIAFFKYENLFLQKQLNYRTQLQDLANYKIKILSYENKYLTDYIRALQTRQNEMISDSLVSDSAYTNDESPKIPALKAQIDRNKSLIGYIDTQLKDNVKMRQEYLDVENALASVKQIEKNLNEQLDRLNGSLILSRLLNRQQSEIPNVQISVNLDELIPNLNIWMYDLRNYRDDIFDIAGYVNNIINQSPELKDHKEELESLVRQRRTLYDQFYQALSEAQTIAINLKLSYTEYQDIKNKVSSLINENLFWLASNLPLSKDLFVVLPSMMRLQLISIKNTITSDAFLSNADNVLLPILAPLLLLAGVIAFFRRNVIRADSKLALRLDKISDGYLVTPLAIINKLILVIPRAVFIIVIGALIIYTSLEDPHAHYEVIGMLTLHVVVFLFFLEVLKPNSLSQRHFAMPPHVVIRQRAFIDKVWFAVIPVLTIANIREIEPIKISGDIFGFCIVYICCIYLTYTILKTLKIKFENEDLVFSDWLKALFALAVPLSILFMLSLGYYYTAIKLINRFAYSFYICMLYVLVSNLIRRELYVAEIKLMRNSKQKLLSNRMAEIESSQSKGKNTKGRKGFDSYFANNQKNNKIEQLRFELINTKAFKLINIFLLVGTAYLLYIQWSDLAGVLSFLDTITIWASKSIVDGKEIIHASLTLADISTAILILIIAVVLNRNLPPLLERLFMLKFSIGHKSTSYTIKIITSYIITTLGIIFAASAVGISWDNLQWLVAALSVGLGFGLQEIFANFVSGLIILFERQIRVGDTITLNDLSGTVNRIRIRATTIISFENKEVVIPNREFITSALTNWSLTNTVTKLEFMVGVAYDADVVRAKQILTSIVRGCRTLSNEKPPRIYISSLDASSVTIMCEVFVNEIADRKPTYDYLSTQTLTRFAKENIEIPFNQLDVKIKNMDNGQTLKIN